MALGRPRPLLFYDKFLSISDNVRETLLRAPLKTGSHVRSHVLGHVPEGGRAEIRTARTREGEALHLQPGAAVADGETLAHGGRSKAPN